MPSNYMVARLTPLLGMRNSMAPNPHPNLMGSPVKYMAEGSAAASTDYGLTSPQWPGKPPILICFLHSLPTRHPPLTAQ